MSAHRHHLPPTLLVAACDPRPLVLVTLARRPDFTRELSAEIDLDSGELVLCDSADERDDVPTYDMMWLPIRSPGDRANVAKFFRDVADQLDGISK